MDFSECAWIVLLGVVSGAAGGLLGIGGSLLMIPGLVILYGPQQQHLYQAAAMIVNFFVVAPAVLRHAAARATLRPVSRWLAPGAVAGILLGVLLSELSIFRGRGQGYLQLTFAAFLLYVISYNLSRLRSTARLPEMSEVQARKLSKFRIVALAGLPAGFFGGLLGVGGGLLVVPAQQLFLRIPLPSAIANSASMILWSSVVGAVLKNSQLARHGFGAADSIKLAALLVPGAMVAAYYTAGKVHVWPVRFIRVVLTLLLAYCCYKLVSAGWSQVCPGS